MLEGAWIKFALLGSLTVENSPKLLEKQVIPWKSALDKNGIIRDIA